MKDLSPVDRHILVCHRAVLIVVRARRTREAVVTGTGGRPAHLFREAPQGALKKDLIVGRQLRKEGFCKIPRDLTFLSVRSNDSDPAPGKTGSVNDASDFKENSYGAPSEVGMALSAAAT